MGSGLKLFIFRDVHNERFVICVNDTSCDEWSGFLTVLNGDECRFGDNFVFPLILVSISPENPVYWNCKLKIITHA